MTDALETLKMLLWSAHHNQHSLTDEVAVCLRSARKALACAAEALADPKRQRQHAFFARQVERQTERLRELEALQETFASLRGEIGALPVFRDKSAVCEPVLAKFAQELAPEVESRAWEFLNEREVG